MTIHNLPLSWYVDRLNENQPFSLASWGDGEWLAATHDKIGGRNAEESVYTQELCDELEAILAYKAENFYICTPDDLKHLGMVGPIDEFLKKKGLEIEFLEKDTWNKAVKEGELGPFLKAVRQKKTAIVSNEAMRGLYFLDYKAFIEAGYPNAYQEIDRLVEEAYNANCEVYVVALGLAGPCFVKRLHERMGDRAFIVEVGSILDIFCGIGGQRGWRMEAYSSTARVLEIRRKNLYGVFD